MLLRGVDQRQNHRYPNVPDPRRHVPCTVSERRGKTVTLEALLTFFGILIAILAIARPVQRESLKLFLRVWQWVLVGAVLLSVALIVCRDAPLGWKPLFGWSLSSVVFWLTFGAFAAPILAALCCWKAWERAKLTRKRANLVESVFKVALREREFDEVERIVRKNLKRLAQLPASATAVLFDPAIVAALVDSHSLVHLELLADLKFLTSLENRFAAVDVVVRQLLRPGVSPLRSAVVDKYDGLEHLHYSGSDRELIERTLQNPAWYVEASAHYPLIISAIETLRTGKLDIEYNEVGRDYEATQGVSKRAFCPIYLAVKTEVLALQAALEVRSVKDFYVSDLFQMFDAVLQRSSFNKSVWEGPLSNREFPTPYAYLLYEITADFRDLSGTAIRVATSQTSHSPKEPGRIAKDLAQNWSFCIWRIADSTDRVSLAFRNDVIEAYLKFVLALHGEPSEAYAGSLSTTVEGLRAWRDLFLNELKSHFGSRWTGRTTALREAFDSLDQGKRYISEGSDWLEEELFG
jgi:hypothetical protein